MDYLSFQERKIIGAILDGAEKMDLLVSVYDGEEWTVTASDNRAAIEYAIGTTDTTTLRFRRATPDESGVYPAVGSVFLVHGNDEDVIADCSDNPVIAELLAPALRLAETFL